MTTLEPNNAPATQSAPPLEPARLFVGHHDLAAILIATLGVGLIFGFQPPLIAFILERHGISSLGIGSITSVSTIAVIVLGPLYPRLINRLGLRRAIVAGTLLAAAALLAMAVRVDIGLWFGLRILTGCALGLAWIASEVWLNRLATDQSRGTIMGIYATVFAVGVVAGPALLQATGTVGLQPFIYGAICLAVTLLPLIRVRSERIPPEDPRPQARFVALLKAGPVIMLAAAVAGLVESADLSLLPLFGLHSGLDEHRSLLLVTVFLVGNVILQLPIGRLADRFGRRRVLASCAVVSVIGPVTLPVAIGVPWLLWPMLFVWGGTLYGFYTQGIALLGETYRAEDLAGANTVYVMVYCAGGVIGPTLGGAAMDLWMPNGLVAFVAGGATVLIAGLLIELARTHATSRLARRPDHSH